ncbi:MAG: 2-C-methyl-D-erythritol 2,4-cyclodiphosphate synthase [Nitrospinota bacterium]|nr:2-C-methyl-D-erythritol 2,4-cyclodiphosphate synthase [Nitrospinota bacterium]
MMRTGSGFDVHRFAKGRDLYLGGVKIPHPLGLEGHSDADVLLHAICDALLGALALGDIGVHFPPTDNKYKGISSVELLKSVVSMVREKGYAIGNLDCTVIAEEPKLIPYREKIRETIATSAGIGIELVSVKATTTEGLGFTGRGEGIAAMAVALLTPVAGERD